MAEALSQRGHEVHVVTYHLGDDVKEVPFSIHRVPDVKTYRKYSPGPTYQKLLVVDSLLLAKLFQVLRGYQIDLIHAHNYEALLISLIVKNLTKHPVIYDAHTLLESELPYYRLGLPTKITKWIGWHLDRRLPKLASHIITVTEDIRRRMIEDMGIASENITVVQNGCEFEHFEIKSRERQALHPGKKTLIYTGNLGAYQRIDLLLKIFREVLKERKDVCLLIVSNSPFNSYDSLLTRLGIREHIEIVPSDFDNLPKYLAGADIALNPRTDCDGIPQKLLNYMSAGKPIVSFAGSAKYLIHGKMGWVVENNNVSAFAKAILLLLKNTTLAQELGANARKYVKEFTWEKTAEKTEEVYKLCSNCNSYQEK